MRWFIHTLALIGIALLTLSILPIVFGQLAVPNFLYSIPIVLAIRHQLVMALFWSITGGFILDLVTPHVSWYTVLFFFTALFTYLMVTEFLPNPTLPITLSLIIFTSFLLPISELLTVGAGWDWQLVESGLMQGIAFALTFVGTQRFMKRT